MPGAELVAQRVSAVRRLAVAVGADPLVAQVRCTQVQHERPNALRDYRTHLQAVVKRSPATINNALAAVDDLYISRGLGPASAARVEIAATAPRALDQRTQLRYLREVQRCPSPRDQALALVPFYAGARISEIVALDIDDIGVRALLVQKTGLSRSQRRPSATVAHPVAAAAAAAAPRSQSRCVARHGVGFCRSP